MPEIQKAELLNQKLKNITNTIGTLLVDGFNSLILFVIGAAIVWSALVSIIVMVEDNHITIEDILLLFIYLELLAMVGIYFKTKHMPVRYLIYVAITALTRMLIIKIQIPASEHNYIIYLFHPHRFSNKTQLIFFLISASNCFGEWFIEARFEYSS